MTRPKTIHKIIRLGTVAAGYPRAERDIFARIDFKDERLSIVGVIGPMRSGDAPGSCGQIIMSFKDYDDRGHHALADITPAPGWTPETIKQFFDVWDRWHLNDVRAGSPVQEQWLRDNPIPQSEYAYPKSHDEVARDTLAAALNPDPNGYKYGHSWNREEVPDDVLAFLESLPPSDYAPAWVLRPYLRLAEALLGVALARLRLFVSQHPLACLTAAFLLGAGLALAVVAANADALYAWHWYAFRWEVAP